MRPNLYDYIKIIAIVFMIIDHIGYTLYPDITILRVIGRLSFPLFFMLIGWNSSSRIRPSLTISAILVQGVCRGLAFWKHYNLWILNILPTIILVKLLLPYIKTIDSLSNRYFPLNTTKPFGGLVTMSIILIGLYYLIPFSNTYIDYGSMTLGMAILGFILKKYRTQRYFLWIPISICLLGLYQINTSFAFTIHEQIFILLSWIIGIYSIRILSYKNYSLKTYSFWDNIVLFCSKYAIWIYTIHFIGFLLRIAFISPILS